MFSCNSNLDLKPPAPEEGNRRYDANELEAYIVKRMGGRKRVTAIPIDYYRKGVGLRMEVPLLEQGDEVMVYLRSFKDPSLALNGMPGVVRYRMGWRNEFRVGIEFNPHRKLLFSKRLREEAERIEEYLANPGNREKPQVARGNEEIDLSSSLVALDQYS